MRQLFTILIWQDKTKGVVRTPIERMVFDKVEKMYGHPSIPNLHIPGPGVFVYNKAKNSIRIQKDTTYDYANEVVIFADSNEKIVQIFGLGFGLGNDYQAWYNEHKSRLILPQGV